MKKIIILMFGILLLSGCGIVTYTIGKNKVSFDESVDFRHLHFKMSDAFDVGSEDNYRFYDLYDKKPNVLYRVAVYQIKGNNDLIEDIEKPLEESKKKYHGKTWNYMSYKIEEQLVHIYYCAYDEDETYMIEFVNAEEGLSFEKAFMKHVRLDTK